VVNVARVVAAGAVIAAMLFSPAWALHRTTPELLAITAAPAGDSANIATEGKNAGWAAFESTADLLGIGSTGRQLFRFDNHPPRSIAQLTSGPGEPANPSMDVSGRRIAFDTSAPPNGSPGGARQIVLWDERSGAFVQLTNGTADSVRPSLDKRGTTAVFESDADLLGNGSTGRQIFLWRAKAGCTPEGCGQIVQVTFTPGTSSHATFGSAGNGKTVAFQSDAPLLGWSNGYQQIFVYDRRTLALTQVTFGEADSIAPSTSSKGRRIAFQSEADLLGDGASGWEIYLYDRRQATTERLTNTPVGDATQPTMNSRERTVGYIAPSPAGWPGPHLFVRDLRDTEAFQVTIGTTGSSVRPVAAGPTMFFFESTEDLLGPALATRQLYVANLFYHFAGISP